MQNFMIGFLSELIERNRDPLWLVLEEGDVFGNPGDPGGQSIDTGADLVQFCVNRI